MDYSSVYFFGPWQWLGMQSRDYYKATNELLERTYGIRENTHKEYNMDATI